MPAFVSRVGGGARVRPGPPRVQGAARPCGTGCAGPGPAGPCRAWAGKGAGRAVALPAVGAPPPRLEAGAEAVDRLCGPRAGWDAGKIASSVGPSGVWPVTSGKDLLRGLPCAPGGRGGLAAAAAGADLARHGPVLGDELFCGAL